MAASSDRSRSGARARYRLRAGAQTVAMEVNEVAPAVVPCPRASTCLQVHRTPAEGGEALPRQNHDVFQLSAAEGRKLRRTRTT